MERLTERNKNGLAMAACCGKDCEYNYICETGGFGECRGMDDIIDRLAAIEDILGPVYDADHLRELIQADREGHRPELPIGRCKDCAHSSPRMVMGNKTYGKVCKIDPYLAHEVNPDGYCDGFKPKEAPNG